MTGRVLTPLAWSASSLSVCFPNSTVVGPRANSRLSQVTYQLQVVHQADCFFLIAFKLKRKYSTRSLWQVFFCVFVVGGD